ncbi:MAG: hypothetical protein GX963_02520 [Bacteroidales bacterium]|nr:hypothetical protein [Bacteroidales bacterium]
MEHSKLAMRHFVSVFLLLILMCGCEKELKGYEKIVGTATINGKEYKESTWWAWNYKGYPSSMILMENYKVFHFLVRLSPEISGEPSYSMSFYVYVNDNQFKTNEPYQIDFYKELEVESLYWGDVIPYFSENRDKILVEDADGIAFAISNTSDDPIPLNGELVLESIDFQSKVSRRYYSFTSPENDSERLVIKGKFETLTATINREY